MSAAWPAPIGDHEIELIDQVEELLSSVIRGLCPQVLCTGGHQSVLRVGVAVDHEVFGRRLGQVGI